MNTPMRNMLVWSTTHLRMLSFLVGLVLVLGSTRYTAADQVQWQKTIEAAKSKAAAEGKVVLIHFWAPFCGPCRELDSFVFSSPEVAYKLNSDVVAVKINTQDLPAIAKEYSISRIPQDVFIDAQGQVLFRRMSPKGSDNYNLMVEAALRIAAETTKQSQMAVAAIESIGKKQAADQDRSAFLGETAAQSGNARDAFSVQAQRNQGALPAATIAVSDASEPTAMLPQNNTAAHFPQHQMQEASFPEATFDGKTQMPLPENRFPKERSLAAPPIPSVAERVEVSNPYLQNENLQPGALQEAGLQRQGTRQVRRQDYVLPEPGSAASASAPITTTTIQSSLPDLAGQALVQKVRAESSDSVADASMSSEQPLGLEGYCPVTLLTAQRWEKGSPDFGCYHRGLLYFFSSGEAMQQFMQAPDQMSPALAGLDPVSFSDGGELLAGKRRFGVFCEVQPGQQTIVLFANEENRERFKQDRRTYLDRIQAATARADQAK